MRRFLSRLRKAIFGVDDAVYVDHRVGHTGAWIRQGWLYEKGDEVPHTNRGHSTYSVRMREGWWISVVQGKVVGWSIRPIHSTVIDADGKPWKGDPAEARGPKYLRP